MKREIKFRAWDEGSKSMMYMHDLQSDETPNEILSVFLDDNYGCELQQFTGLTDKNGKDIYEGDVIELINEDNDRIKVVCEFGIARREILIGNGSVEVDISCFYFLLPNGKKSFPIVNNYAGKHDLQLFEIIGNIYERPELITQ